jgi:hypothetical protein
MSHSSWFTYQAMLRIFKHYDFNLDDDYTMAKAVSFSSYPGLFLGFKILRLVLKFINFFRTNSLIR